MQEKRLNTLSRLQDAFVKADEDGSGSVTLEELEQVAEDPDVAADFENLDIHPSESSRGERRVARADRSCVR